MNFIHYLTPILALTLLIDDALAGEYRQFNFTSNCRGGGSDMIHQRILFLEQGKAALVNESWNTKFLPLLDTQCMVVINTTTRYSGLFAVIQKLNFRTKSSGKSECRDYIQIRYGGSDKTSKICEEIGTEETPAISFNSPTGEMSVQLHIGGRSPDDLEEFIEISMVLTNYRDCDDSFAFSCFRNNKGCIPLEYYRDSVVNCNAPLCADEVSCLVGQQSVMRKTLNSSNIALSAITSFIFTAVAVGGCLWCCWKYRFCLEECFAGPAAAVATVAVDQQTNTVTSQGAPIELQLPESTSSTQAQQSRSEDKDLPPSYDTLFPDK
uniref:Putative conserved secreted protein n=1 Tax=Phlebotomus kandelakii TaxID=1109342 RepID=A0A6B2E685_9DIPT